MAIVGRISSLMRYLSNRNYVVGNQTQFAEHSTRLNTGQRLIHNYDSVDGGKEVTQLTGQIVRHTTIADNQAKAITELELAESSLNSMKTILDQIKTDALQGGSDTVSDEDLTILGVQLRNLGENFYALSNAKIGNKYLFGGLQSDLKVVTHVPGSLFANASYKEGNTDKGERVVEDIQSSIGLGSIYTTQAATAKYTGTAVSAPLAANTELNLVVNDGTQDINVGDISLTAGDSVATIVTKINTAFTAAGGTGSIVQENSGKLEFDTSLITNDIPNSNAAVVISPGSTLPNTLSSLGLVSITAKGTSTNIREALNNMDAAYNSADGTSIRNAVIDIEANIDRLISIRAELGDLVSKFTDAESTNFNKRVDLEIDQADIATIPVAEAIQKVTAAQAAVNASMQAGATIMSQNVFDFIRF